MSGLTEQDRETLARSMGAHWDRVIGMNPMGEWQATDADLVEAIASDIEAIVARHVVAALTDIEGRCARAAGELLALSTTVAEARREYEAMRLLGKRDGVRLAMSYLDEAVRTLTPDG